MEKFLLTATFNTERIWEENYRYQKAKRSWLIHQCGLHQMDLIEATFLQVRLKFQSYSCIQYTLDTTHPLTHEQTHTYEHRWWQAVGFRPWLHQWDWRQRLQLSREFLISYQNDIKNGMLEFFSGCAWGLFAVQCVVVIHCVYIQTLPTEWLWPPSHSSPWKCRVTTSKTFSRLFQSGAWNNTVTNTTRMAGYKSPSSVHILFSIRLLINVQN